MAFGGQQGTDTAVPVAEAGVHAGDVGEVAGAALHAGQGAHRDRAGHAEGGSGVAGVVFGGDAVEPDSERAEEDPAHSAQVRRAAEAAGDRGGFVREFAHAVPVTGAGGGVRGGLDQQTAPSAAPPRIPTAELQAPNHTAPPQGRCASDCGRHPATPQPLANNSRRHCTPIPHIKLNNTPSRHNHEYAYSGR